MKISSTVRWFNAISGDLWRFRARNGEIYCFFVFHAEQITLIDLIYCYERETSLDMRHICVKLLGVIHRVWCSGDDLPTIFIKTSHFPVGKMTSNLRISLDYSWKNLKHLFIACGILPKHDWNEIRLRVFPRDFHKFLRSCVLSWTKNKQRTLKIIKKKTFITRKTHKTSKLTQKVLPGSSNHKI